MRDRYFSCATSAHPCPTASTQRAGALAGQRRELYELCTTGKEVILATGYAKRSFQSFRLGYMQYHHARSVWYDDVVVAPARVNCK